MSKVKRIPVHTPKNILSDAFARADEFDSVIIIGLTKAGECNIGRSDQSGCDLAYSAIKFQAYVDFTVNQGSPIGTI